MNELNNFGILLIMIGGNDISSKTSKEPAKFNIKQAMDHLKELLAYARQQSTGFDG